MNRVLAVLLGVMPLVGWSWSASHAQSGVDGPKASERKNHDFVNSIGMKLVLLPPGEFTMGRTEEQLDTILTMIKSGPKIKRSYEGHAVWSMLMMPGHRVRLTKPFYVGATEVTVGEFRKFADASGYKTEAEQGLNGGLPYKSNRPISTWRKPMAWRMGYKQKDDEPVLHLCYNDCVAFCKWLSEKEGRDYCLPTEAEWEYACRAGTTTPWHFGDFKDVPRVAQEYAWWSEGPQGKHEVPRSVAQGKPNAFGLYDMHGNVWEYVADWWHRMYYKESPLNDPTGPDTQDEFNGLRRIIRGSSFDWDSWGGDAAYRMRISQRSTQHPHMGFRVAMRLKGVEGVPPAVDPKDELRRKKRDPGADSAEVLAALKRGTAKDQLAKELTIDLGGGVKMEFVLIPAGSFLMGSDKGFKDEGPVHRVVISKPFYMAKYEITQSQWELVMGKHPHLEELRKAKDHDGVGPNKAMNEMSWNQCQDYIRKLKVKAPGHAFALPTEAQWEYACRAGSTTEYHFGNDDKALGDYAWFQGNMNWVGHPGYRGKLFYHDVGMKKPNAFGLHDMHGGVWEWCADRYDPDTYFTAPLVDPTGPEKGPFRVLRGGSWFRYAKYARSSYRKFFHPDGDGDATTAYILDFGCRLVINLTDPPAKAGLEKAPLTLAENLVKYQGNPVFGPGKPGDWDDQGCGCFSLSKVGDQFMLWYNASSKSRKEWQIGLATSADGFQWKRSAANPVMGSGGMPSVLKDGNTFTMLYAADGGFKLATSKDSVTWKQHGSGPVLRGVGESNDPCLHKFGEEFVLWYCGKFEGHYRILRATSADCLRWKLDPQPVIPLGQPGEFDSNGHAGPEVLKVENIYYLFFLGNDKKRARWSAGVATSKDGKSWTKSSANPVLDIGGPKDWDSGSLMGLAVLWLDGRFHVWYAALAADAKDRSEAEAGIRIGYATSQTRQTVIPRETPAEAKQRHERVAERRKGVDIICHRGASEFAHENTLEAYRAAFALGADGNEIDIRSTKDCVLICFHDDSLDQLLEAYGDVSDYTWEELQRFRFRNPGRFGEQCRIPTLAEVFDLHRRYAGLIHLDIKRPGLDRAIADLLTRMDMWDHVAYCNTENGGAILSDSRLRLRRYKAPGLYGDHSEMFPEVIAAVLKRPGNGVIVDDPRAVAIALGRKLGKLSQEPVSPRQVVPPQEVAKLPSEAELIALLRDAADWNRVAETPADKAASGERIHARARAAEQLLVVRASSPEALAALEERVRNRSLHKEWRCHGLDGAMALRTLILLRAPNAVETARFALWRDDPALEPVIDPRWRNPRAWTDFRVKMVIWPALAHCPGPATEQLCREYLAQDDIEAHKLGPPQFDQAARALLAVSPRAETALELMKHRLQVVRGRAILDCLAQATEAWARDALERGAPHALALRVDD